MKFISARESPGSFFGSLAPFPTTVLAAKSSPMAPSSPAALCRTLDSFCHPCPSRWAWWLPGLVPPLSYRSSLVSALMSRSSVSSWAVRAGDRAGGRMLGSRLSASALCLGLATQGTKARRIWLRSAAVSRDSGVLARAGEAGDRAWAGS